MEMSNLIMNGMFTLVIGMLLVAFVVEVSMRQFDKKTMVSMSSVPPLPNPVFGVGSIVQVIALHERDVYTDGVGVHLDACYVVKYDFTKLGMLSVIVQVGEDTQVLRTLLYKQVKLIWRDTVDQATIPEIGSEGEQLEMKLDV